MSGLLVFCPYCCSQLLLQRADHVHFACSACPYSVGLVDPIRTCSQPKLKHSGRVISGAADDRPKTVAVCPNCHARQAFYVEMQIRSGDEPMTTFYECCECSHNWKEG